MKQLVFIILLLVPPFGFAANPNDTVSRMLLSARLSSDYNSRYYNPSQAFKFYTKLANQMNAEAMNGLGVMYSKGIGRTVDDEQAIFWFEKSAKQGYGNAWYNWGTMVKNGIGTQQDFIKAYNCYKEGAELGNKAAQYGQGFMLYKGLGCNQSYEMAFQLFTKSAEQNCEGAMYMKGLCFRNGYGVSVNLDSARYWLNKAANLGYQYAKEELASPVPENTNISNAVVLLPSGSDLQTAMPDIKIGYPKVKHNFGKNNIDGEYTGYALKFDWSGKHIIAESTLKLNLKHSGKTLNGTWTEDNGVSTQFDAQLTDTSLIFNDTRYSKQDHYNTKSPNDFEFKNAKLQLLKNADTVIITGNLQLYSTKIKEPEKPTFLMLIRNNINQPIEIKSEDTTTCINEIATTKTDSVKFIVYPNPISNTLNAQFTLTKACVVRLIVSKMIDAHIVYQGVAKQMEAGEHTITLQLNGLTGTYVSTLNYGNKLKSVMVIKK